MSTESIDTVTSTQPSSATTSFSLNGWCQSFLALTEFPERSWKCVARCHKEVRSWIYFLKTFFTFGCFLFFCWFLYGRNWATTGITWILKCFQIETVSGLCGWLLSRSLISQKQNKAWPATLERLASSRSAWGTPFTLVLFCGFPMQKSDTGFQDGRWFLGFQFSNRKDSPQHCLLDEIGDRGYHQ